MYAFIFVEHVVQITELGHIHYSFFARMSLLRSVALLIELES